MRQTVGKSKGLNGRYILGFLYKERIHNKGRKIFCALFITCILIGCTPKRNSRTVPNEKGKLFLEEAIHSLCALSFLLSVSGRAKNERPSHSISQGCVFRDQPGGIRQALPLGHRAGLLTPCYKRDGFANLSVPQLWVQQLSWLNHITSAGLGGEGN